MILLARGRFGATATRVMEPLRVHGPMAREAIAAGERPQPGHGSPHGRHAVGRAARPGAARPRRARHGRAVPACRSRSTRTTSPCSASTSGARRPRSPWSTSPAAPRPTCGSRHRPARAPARLRSPRSRSTPWSPPSARPPPAWSRATATARCSAPVSSRPGSTSASPRRTYAVALELATGLPTAAADHVAAVAAAEYLAREEALTGCTMYLYARDTAGFALANDLPAAHRDLPRRHGSATSRPAPTRCAAAARPAASRPRSATRPSPPRPAASA